MYKKIFLKNLLAASILSATVTNGLWAHTAPGIDKPQLEQDDKQQDSWYQTFNKLVTINKQSFILRCNFVIPDNETMQKAIAGKIFGDSTLLLMPAMKGFMAKVEISDKQPKKLYGNNFISMGCQHLDTYYCGDYEFRSHIYYVKHTVSKPWKNGGAGLPEEVRGRMIFDVKQNKVLAVADILTQDAINSMRLDPQSTDMQITPKGKLICYTTAKTGKGIDLSLENKAMFNDYFKTVTDEKALDERAQMEAEKNGLLKAKEIIAEERPNDKERPLDIAEVMPSFPGGDAKLMTWLSQNIQYPAIAEENGVQGRVIVRFVVGKDGTIRNPKILRSVDPSLDKEALRVVKAMPIWIPGKQKGIPVAVYFTLPVTFQLQ